jgi:hypothetical protein
MKLSRQQQMRQQIAAAAARLMAQDGIDDFALAKRKAARQLGLGDTPTLPGNDEIEAQLRAYQGLYQEQEQRERLHDLRLQAVNLMKEIESYRPYLTGQVLSGIAGRYGDIDLQVFTDDAKSLELLFLNRGIDYSVAERRHWIGGEARNVTVLTVDWKGTQVNISLLGEKDERVALRTSPSGRVVERAALPAVELLIASSG